MIIRFLFIKKIKNIKKSDNYNSNLYLKIYIYNNNRNKKYDHCKSF